jgi:isopenicillin N synthase-like dioxygenase
MLQTFALPARISGYGADRALAERMIAAWRTDGTFQVRIGPEMAEVTQRAFDAGRGFFALPPSRKSHCASDLSYSGYAAAGEEITAGDHDGAEAFTACKDLPAHDARVIAGWPCHGPVPWPHDGFRAAMAAFMDAAGGLGDRLLQLTALGLGLPLDALTRLTCDGWHHMRALHFPEAPGSARGIGAHTDHGLLVIAAQDDAGGLCVRPPVQGEARRRNWIFGESTAGRHEDEEPWIPVEPAPRALTVFPGDVMQFVTGGHLLATPHLVRPAARERHAMAYFHEPHFQACVRPLLGDAAPGECMHYGTHFTRMFARRQPERATTRRLAADDRWTTLAALREQAMGSPRLQAMAAA